MQRAKNTYRSILTKNKKEGNHAVVLTAAKAVARRHRFRQYYHRVKYELYSPQNYRVFQKFEIQIITREIQTSDSF